MIGHEIPSDADLHAPTGVDVPETDRGRMDVHPRVVLPTDTERVAICEKDLRAPHEPTLRFRPGRKRKLASWTVNDDEGSSCVDVDAEVLEDLKRVTIIILIRICHLICQSFGL